MENKDASPARYLLKIDSFSLLSDNGIDKYESSEFESSGHKWKMIIYLDGDGSEDGRDHISMYLAIAETSSLHAGWEVNATFSFLVFDHIRDKYIVLRGMEGRFHNVMTERGFSNCISHATFKKPSNGYLVNDKCVFGVDVYVIKNQLGGECISLLDDIVSYKHEWKISEFTKLSNKLSSEEFTVEDYEWKIDLYPTGDGSQNGQYISIFLVSVDAKGFDSRKKVKAKFSFSVKDQITGGVHKMTGSLRWFSAAADSWGWTAYMALSELKDPKKGLLVNDCCIIEAKVSLVGVVDGLT